MRGGSEREKSQTTEREAMEKGEGRSEGNEKGE